MRNVVFVAPYLKDTTLRFVRAARALEGVRVLGICARQRDGIGEEDREPFDELVEVDDALDTYQIEAAARAYGARHGSLHRIVSVLEQAQLAVARARSALGLAGLPPEAAERFLNKSVMKRALREYGLPCAQDALVGTWDEACAFVARVGFPVVMKPAVGAACASTFRVEDHEQLGSAFGQVHPTPEAPAQLEEFMTGQEFSFDTVTVGGRVRFHSISQYLPNPLDAMRHPWIQWTYLAPRDIGGHEFDEVRRVGTEAVERLGMVSGITHMEWFRRPDGSIAIGEIAARPPGAQITPVMGLLHDTDFFRVWARAVIDEAFDGPWERRYAAGTAFLRGAGEGRTAGYHGVDEIRARWGHLIAREYLPVIGMPKAASYEGDGFYTVRGEDTEEVARALRDIVGTFRMWYH